METKKRKRKFSKTTGSVTEKCVSKTKRTGSIVSTAEDRRLGSCAACFKRVFGFEDDKDNDEQDSISYELSTSGTLRRTACNEQEITVSVVSNIVKDNSHLEPMHASIVLKTMVSRRFVTKTERKRKKQEMKAAITLTAILLVFLITWLPYNIAVVIFTLCRDCISSSVWSFGMYLGIWIIYCKLYEQFINIHV